MLLDILEYLLTSVRDRISGINRREGSARLLVEVDTRVRKGHRTRVGDRIKLPSGVFDSVLDPHTEIYEAQNLSCPCEGDPSIRILNQMASSNVTESLYVIRCSC